MADLIVRPTDSDPGYFTNPHTGEALTLRAATADLARLLSDIRYHESVLREIKGAVSREILERMDRETEWTIHAENGLKITGVSPQKKEVFDAGELRTRLLEFADEGVLSISAVDRAVEQIISWKVHADGIKALRKLGGDVARAVDACATEVEPDRRVSVSRPLANL